jgi:hypothetical protein
MNAHQKTTQATISDQSEIKPHQGVEKFALFLEDGTPLAEFLADLESRVNDLENP